MQKNIKIFVEGVADKKFILDYLNYILPNLNINSQDIINSLGWENSREKSQNQMMLNRDNGGINLVIFDADDDLEKRRYELNKWKISENLNFELYLFPNNKDTGALEDLLEKIIVDKNQPIFDCWKD